jgi:hypothetical protein
LIIFFIVIIIIDFIENQSACIDILKDNEIHEYFFPRLPYCVFRFSSTKDEFLATVNRTNSKTKCEDLVRNSKVLLIVLKIDYYLRNNITRFLGLFTKHSELWKNYCTFF